MFVRENLQKLLFLLGVDLRKRSVLVFVLMLTGMALEMLSIGLVLPIIGLVASSDLAHSNVILESMQEWLGNPSQTQLLVCGIIALCAIYAIKNLYLLALSWVQSSFIFAFQSSLSRRLFAVYLMRSYRFHVQQNSSKLVQNIITEVNQLTNSIQAILTIGAEVLVLVGVTSLLFYFEPIATLSLALVLGGAGFVFYYMIRKKLSNWGANRQKNEEKRIKIIQEGLGGIKEIKLFGSESAFLKRFNELNLNNARMYRNQMFLLQVPRLWLEVIAVLSLAIVILVHVWQGRSASEFLPVVGLFGAAAFRLMPSINRCLTSLQSTRFAHSAINTLYQELLEGVDKRSYIETGRGSAAAGVRFSDRIDLSGINFQYPQCEVSVLRDIHLTIPRGALMGFIGESGAGKSTLVDVILGLMEPSSGSVLVDGTDIRNFIRDWQNQIGYVPQAIYLIDDSLRRNVAFGQADVDIDEMAIWRALRAAQLDDFVRQLPQGLDTLVGERGVRLSGGQRQRIGIARALYHDPSVLVLDEATSALDTDTETGVIEAVRAMRGKKTILIITHRLSTVEHCDTVVRLVAGKIIELSGAVDTPKSRIVISKKK